jgi:hypothetical protein
LIPTLVAFLTTFYRETTMTAPLENHDFSEFFKILEVFGDESTTKFVSDYVGKVLRSRSNHTEFARLLKRFAPSELSRVSDAAIETLILEASSDSDIASLLGNRATKSHIIHSLKRDILFRFPNSMLFIDLTDSNQEIRFAAEAFVYRQFPTVTHADNYQKAENLISGSSSPDYSRMVGTAGANSPRDDALHVIAAGNAFLSESLEALGCRATSLLMIVQ